MNRNTQHVALCGIFGALALLVMLAGDLLPLAVYLCPALAGLLILPVAYEAGRRTGWLFYIGISLLSLLLLPDREPAVLFVAFLGYYPLVKATLERISCRPLRWLVKLALFNGTVLAAYYAMLHLFGFAGLAEDFAGMTGGLWAALLALANLTFALYDVAVARLGAVYLTVLRPRIQKGRR